MTVKELIEKLKVMPKNATVLNGGDSYSELEKIKEDFDGDVVVY